MDRCATRRLGYSGYAIGTNARVLWVLYRLLVLSDTTGRQQVYVDDRSSCASASQSESQQARTYAVRRVASAVQYFGTVRQCEHSWYPLGTAVWHSHPLPQAQAAWSSCSDGPVDAVRPRCLRITSDLSTPSSLSKATACNVLCGHSIATYNTAIYPFVAAANPTRDGALSGNRPTWEWASVFVSS
jgi:hypothetical protein